MCKIIPIVWDFQQHGVKSMKCFQFIINLNNYQLLKKTKEEQMSSISCCIDKNEAMRTSDVLFQSTVFSKLPTQKLEMALV